MQEEKKMNDTERNSMERDAVWHRRRINRIKTMIVVIVILLFLIPTVLCIYLGFKVSRLQNQMDFLIGIHTADGTELELAVNKGGDYRYVNGAQIMGTGGKTKAYDPLGIQSAAGPAFSPISVQESSAKVVSDGTDTVSQDEKKTGLTGNQDAIPEEGAAEGALPTGLPHTDAARDGTLDNPDTTVGNGPLGSDGSIADENTGTVTDVSTELPGPDSEAGMNEGIVPGDITKKDGTAAGQPIKQEEAAEPGTIKISSTGIYAGKKVYLTFDDGPSNCTEEILDTLKEFDVKATFFVIGKTDKESKRLYKRIVEEGHTLGMHSYSHAYKQIYNSLEDFDKDFTKLWKLLYDTTGYMPTIYRFPGGSGNKVNAHGMDEFIRYLNDKSILYYDWNVDNGDATGKEFTTDELIKNVLDGVAAKKRSIVLMHDSQGKQTTMDSLPQLLEILISGGAEVLPITGDVAPIQQIKANEVK